MTKSTNMELTRDYSVFIEEFLDINIDPTTFSHLDHIGVGFEMLKKFEFLMAVQIFSESLNAIVIGEEEGEKFNLTITLAMMSIISERMLPGEEVEDFIEANTDLLDKNFLMQYYTQARLHSFLAHGMFLMPDIKPFSEPHALLMIKRTGPSSSQDLIYQTS